MSWIVLKFLRTDWNQIVHIERLTIYCRPESCHWKLSGSIGAFTSCRTVLTIVSSTGWHQINLLSCRGSSSNHLLLELLRLLSRGRISERTYIHSDVEVIINLNITYRIFIWLIDQIWATNNPNLEVDRVRVRRHISTIHTFNSLLCLLKLFDSMLFWKRSVYNFVAVSIRIFVSSWSHCACRNRWFMAFTITTTPHALFVVWGRIYTRRERMWALMSWSTLSVTCRDAIILDNHFLCRAATTRLWLSLLDEIAPGSLLLLTAWVFMVVGLQVGMHGASLTVLLL